VTPEEKAARERERRLAARSWLLRVGWERHGRISLSEGPKPERVLPGGRFEVRRVSRG
jgi:hypothetical protein